MGGNTAFEPCRTVRLYLSVHHKIPEAEVIDQEMSNIDLFTLLTYSSKILRVREREVFFLRSKFVY